MEEDWLSYRGSTPDEQGLSWATHRDSWGAVDGAIDGWPDADTPGVAIQPMQVSVTHRYGAKRRRLCVLGTIFVASL